MGSTKVVNLEALTYAGNLDALALKQDHPDQLFIRGNIGERVLVSELLSEHCPGPIVNLAAESHVDRSIVGVAWPVDEPVLSIKDPSALPLREIRANLLLRYRKD